MKFMRSVLVIIASVFLLGCNKVPPQARSIPEAVKATQNYSKDELQRQIVIGMSMAEVTNKFGAPGSLIKADESRFLMQYYFPLTLNRHEGLAGFSIDIKDGAVQRWSPIESVGGGSELTDDDVISPLGERLFQIYIIPKDKTNMDKIVSKDGVIQFDDLKLACNLAFNAKVYVGNKDKEGWQSVHLFLGEQDSLKLGSLTETNIDKQLLIMCRDQKVVFTRISMALSAPSFEFRVKDISSLTD